ncbi:hypothetical protein Taro_030691 [Colocasia esculenta]|uniref:Uncharacterized protein n=1 Tax=Colocasia esculenta TaxID=4460 RepID=A0A843VGY6_COLES|nr:hypothetical protein [Colocasia esculenta]
MHPCLLRSPSLFLLQPLQIMGSRESSSPPMRLQPISSHYRNIGRVLQVALRTSQLTNAMTAYACVELDLLKDRPSRSLAAEGLLGAVSMGLADMVPSPEVDAARSFAAAAGDDSSAEAFPGIRTMLPPPQGNSELLGQDPAVHGFHAILGAENPHQRRGSLPTQSPAGDGLAQDARILHPPEDSLPPYAAAVLGSEDGRPAEDCHEQDGLLHLLEDSFPPNATAAVCSEDGRPITLGSLSTKVGSLNQAAQDKVEPNVGNFPAVREVASTCEMVTLPIST